MAEAPDNPVGDDACFEETDSVPIELREKWWPAACHLESLVNMMRGNFANGIMIQKFARCRLIQNKSPLRRNKIVSIREFPKAELIYGLLRITKASRSAKYK